MLGGWWILDMLFVWVSPRSYVEYYLPLNASAAMCAAYAVHTIREFIINRLPANAKRLPSVVSVGLFIAVCLLMVGFSKDNRSKFADRVKQTANMRSQKLLPPWEQVAQYINTTTSEDDELYVWGWVPGIYVQAQRYCPARHPAESNMHTSDPFSVNQSIRRLLNDLKTRPPKIIVDSQKDHFPYVSHPRFDLWPRTFNRTERKFDLKPPIIKPQGKPALLKPTDFKSSHNAIMNQVEQYTFDILTQRPRSPLPKENARNLARLERRRHEAMAPLREFIMENYQPLSLPFNSNMYIFKLNPTSKWIK